MSGQQRSSIFAQSRLLDGQSRVPETRSMGDPRVFILTTRLLVMSERDFVLRSGAG